MELGTAGRQGTVCGEANLRLVVSIAKLVCGPRHAVFPLTLIQEDLGLIKAVEKVSRSSYKVFQSTATWSGSVRPSRGDHRGSGETDPGIPAHMVETINNKAHHAMSRQLLQEELGREPTRRIAEEMKDARWERVRDPEDLPGAGFLETSVRSEEPSGRPLSRMTMYRCLRMRQPLPLVKGAAGRVCFSTLTEREQKVLSVFGSKPGDGRATAPWKSGKEFNVT